MAMGYYYKFYRPYDMKKIDEGKFSGMPFFYTNIKPEPILFPDEENTFGCYTGIMNRAMAMEYQRQMTSNQTIFTDMMDEYSTDCLIFRIT
jgi:hypothetical protein